MDKTISIYSQIFSTYSKGADFYRTVFTLPVNPEALKAVLTVNSESAGASDVQTLRDLFENGVKLLSEVVKIENEDIEEDNDLTDSALSESLHLIDDELKNQLISNILIILQVFFQSLHQVNIQFKKKKSTDIIPLVFEPISIQSLLQLVKWQFQLVVKDIEIKDGTLDLSLLKEIIFLVSDILKALYFSIHIKESIAVKHLLGSFFDVDFASDFESLLTLSNPKFDPQTERFKEAKIMISFDSLIKVYTILGTLSNIPSNLIPVSTSSDITNLKNESPNIYEHRMIRIKTIDNFNYKQDFELKLIPIFASNFNYFYKFREDLLVTRIQNDSFFTWLTGSLFSSNLYIASDTVDSVTDFLNYVHLSLTRKRDAYLQEIERVYENRVKYKNSDNFSIPEFLPITLLLYTYTQNITFLLRFTKQINEANLKIEDVDDKAVELFEIWLCLLSYIFQYQYKSKYMESTTKLSLIILLKLTSNTGDPEVEGISVLDNLTKYQVNEYKWKLSHQKSPIVPNNKGELGIKSSLFYILDILQNLIRFNLTKKLNIDNYKLSLNVMFRLLHKIDKVASESAEILTQVVNYSWNELTNTLIQLVRFIKVQDLLNYKHFHNRTEKVKSLIEEILVIMDLILAFKKHDKSVVYDLVYAILLNYEVVKQFMLETRELSRLEDCLDYFEDRFHLTDESKESQQKKIDLFEVEFDSPVLVKEINLFSERDEITESKTGFKHLETFEFEGLTSDEMIRVFTDAEG